MFGVFEKILFELEIRLDYPIVMDFFSKTFTHKWTIDNNLIQNDLKLSDKTFHNTKLLVVLTTFNRPEGCLRVINSLLNSIRHKKISLNELVILVLNDKSGSEYQPVEELCRQNFGQRLIWMDARQHHGKKYFWCVHQMAFLLAREIRPARCLYLQDDIDFQDDFLDKLDQLWMLTSDDDNRRVLYLFSDHNDDYEINGRWIDYERENHPSGLLRKTQWFDLQAFYCDLRFLELLNFRVMPVPEKRWENDSALSSGVGRQFTCRSFGKANIYQCNPSLITHGYEDSAMNPEARILRELDNR